MALMQANFYASTLGLCTQTTVILPRRHDPEKRFPVLYLLHGSSDDHSIWLRRTNIERYVDGMDLAVVMPSAHLSRYENMLHGPRYFDYITEELPQIMQEFFPISGKPEEQYIAGLSMGGMGALKAGLTRPELYAAVGCFSSGNLFYRDPEKYRPAAPRNSGGVSVMEAVYGSPNQADMKGTDWDPFVQAERWIKRGETGPRFFHVCGTEDFLLDSARLTRDWFEQHPQLDYTYQEAPGAHTWEFWDTWVQEFLAFIQ